MQSTGNIANLAVDHHDIIFGKNFFFFFFAKYTFYRNFEKVLDTFFS